MMYAFKNKHVEKLTMLIYLSCSKNFSFELMVHTYGLYVNVQFRKTCFSLYVLLHFYMNN